MAAKIRKTEEYSIHTSQEVEAIGHAAADGKHGRNYENWEYPDARVHRVPGKNHLVRIPVLDGEDGFGAIEQLTARLDTDTHLGILYILSLLAPVAMRQPSKDECWIGFDDVIAKIGWDPRSAEERREMHRRVFDILRFGARAVVIGQRSEYRNPNSKKKVNTQIESSMWQIHEVERPEQLHLPLQGEAPEAPIKAQLIITPRWVEFLTTRELAQYLPLGEILGAIPGNKPSGAWARVLGLSLASFWRRNRVRSLDGSMRPTRRELLEDYPPKTGSVHDLLAGPNPIYAVNYWHGALKILVDSGFIEPAGEAALTVKEARAAMPRKDWAQDWLDGRVDIRPKETMQAAMQQVTNSAPVKKKRE